MIVLIVEDDDDKRRRIAAVLREKLSPCDVIEARSLRSGLRLILQQGADVVLLDMTMPSFDIALDEDGGRPQAYAGRELLRHMSENGLKTPAIVVTQFEKFGEGADALTLEQLDRQLRREHEQYRGAVYYNSASDEWKDILVALIMAEVA